MELKTKSFLGPWLEGRELPSLKQLEICIPNLVDGLWLSINYELPLHLVNQGNEILGLNEAWQRTRAYSQRAIELVFDYNGSDLDHEERADILSTLGPPPDVAHPIYFVAVCNSTSREVVYVGKSASNQSRFTNGHSVAIKLHDPKYAGFDKMIYWAQIMLWSDEHQYLPIEFVGNKKLADDILDDVESRLIYALQPVLNVKKKKSLSQKLEIGAISVETAGSPGGFLDGESF